MSYLNRVIDGDGKPGTDGPRARGRDRLCCCRGARRHPRGEQQVDRGVNYLSRAPSIRGSPRRPLSSDVDLSVAVPRTGSAGLNHTPVDSRLLIVIADTRQVGSIWPVTGRPVVEPRLKLPQDVPASCNSPSLAHPLERMYSCQGLPDTRHSAHRLLSAIRVLARAEAAGSRTTWQFASFERSRAHSTTTPTPPGGSAASTRSTHRRGPDMMQGRTVDDRGDGRGLIPLELHLPVPGALGRFRIEVPTAS